MGRPLHEGLAASNRLIARQTRGIPAEGTTYAKALRRNRAGPSTAAQGTYDGRAAQGWDDWGGVGQTTNSQIAQGQEESSEALSKQRLSTKRTGRLKYKGSAGPELPVPLPLLAFVSSPQLAACTSTEACWPASVHKQQRTASSSGQVSIEVVLLFTFFKVHLGTSLMVR